MSGPACHRSLRRFWFRLDSGSGIGVTAPSESEAHQLAEDTRARVHPESTIVEVVPDVRIEDLDPDRVLPNMGLVVVRGVWFPNLNVR